MASKGLSNGVLFWIKWLEEVIVIRVTLGLDWLAQVTLDLVWLGLMGLV